MVTRDQRSADGYEAKYMSGGGEVLYRDKMVGGRGWRALLLGLPVAATILGSTPALLVDPSPATIAFAVGGTLFATVPFLLFSTLRVTVSTEQVHVQFGLWGPKIPIASIVASEVVSYDWKEYGGFGIRRGGDGSWVYNMMGDQGRAVKVRWMKDGKEHTHLLSSNDPQALASAIREARARLDRDLAATEPAARARVEATEDDEAVVEADSEVEAARRAR
jgi:hypothetical protein